MEQLAQDMTHLATIITNLLTILTKYPFNAYISLGVGAAAFKVVRSAKRASR